MTRPIQHLGRLLVAIVATLTLTSGAWAEDRYGPTGYDEPSLGYSAEARALDPVDPCGVQYHLTGRSCRDQGPPPAYRPSARRRIDESRATWSCPAESRHSGRDCGPPSERYAQRGDDDWRGGGGGQMDPRDPCHDQARPLGRGCAPDLYGSGPREPIPYTALPYERSVRDGRAWNGAMGDPYDHAWTRDRIEDRAQVVDACAIVHQRRGDRCPYQDLEADYGVVGEEESLPDGFFLDEGGVGPGIADFGGDGGGGYVIAEGGGSASASANASASVSVSVMASITAHNHGGHYPPMRGGGWNGGGSWGGGKGGCGCKKGR